MSDLVAELNKLVGEPESETLEYKAVLPPSRVIAQLICGFANNKGGYLILGVSDAPHGVEVKGLSEDFQAPVMTHRALDLLSPKPPIEYQYFQHDGKKLFGIKTEASLLPVYLEGRIYHRIDSMTVERNPPQITFAKKGYGKIKSYSTELLEFKKNGTDAKHRLLGHYLSVLKIIDDLADTLYPESPATPTTIAEGKILCRILFSSYVDNFETYLSDLLFEVYLGKPEALKTKQTVTIEEVLNCVDIQDFVRYCAKQKLYKLQKGSVKGFIKDNTQLSDLKVLDEPTIDKIESVLQIRHLFAHRNGIIDEKFIQHFPGCVLNTEFEIPVADICQELIYLATIAQKLDEAAIKKYDLAKI